MDKTIEKQEILIQDQKVKNKGYHHKCVIKNENQEIKKMRQGMSYTSKEKTIILNVFKYFRNQFPDKCVTELVRRTAKATGCSEKSVFQFRKEENSGEGFKEPSKTKIRVNLNINSRDIKYDNTVRSAIRSIIYDLQYKNIVPSLNKILKQINVDKNLPKFSIMTLRRLMLDMGFWYQKNGNKSILVEQGDPRLCDTSNQPPQLPTQPLVPDLRLQGSNCLPPPAQIQPQQEMLPVQQHVPPLPPHHMMPPHQGPPPPHLPSSYHQMQHLPHTGPPIRPTIHPPGPPPPHLTPWSHINNVMKPDAQRPHLQHHVEHSIEDVNFSAANQGLRQNVKCD